MQIKKTINEKELEVLNFWQENKIFEKSVESPAGKDFTKEPRTDFSFYDGPPFATGLPHHGHILAGTIKDSIPRYQTMKGKSVRRVWGWDCHGLPIENLIEKEFGLNSKKDIVEFGVDKFNKAAADSVLRYESEWKKIVPRLGRWVDMENSYKTMDWTFTESVWWVWKSLYDKGLAYEGSKMMHICPRCETPLAQSEVNQPGAYKDISDISVTVEFELEEKENGHSVYMLAWTTTPWTLPGNSALAVNKNIEYVKIQETGVCEGGDINNTYEAPSNNIYIVSKKYFESNFKSWGNDINKYDNKINTKYSYSLIGDILGVDLVGKKYKQLFPIKYPELYEGENYDNSFRVWHADFITDDAGTGIAHEAPAFGSEDMELAQEKNIPFVKHVKFNGEFTDLTIDSVLDYVSEEDKSALVKVLQDLKVKKKGDSISTDIVVIKWLAHNEKLFSKEKIVHSYPHCWRCDTPLLNYATSSWFVDVPKIKDRLVEENKKVGWTPEHVRDGRFGRWLEGAREWAVSRTRYWGALLPIWKNEDGTEVFVAGSLQDLIDKSGDQNIIPKDETGNINLHKPYIDKVILKDSKGRDMKIIGDVFDCWFESGSMPYGQLHYPFENKEVFEKNFPADFIAEGMDQTRGWFYSLINLGVGLFDKSPYKNVIVNGTVMAGDGQKMSKSLRNYTDPMILVEKFGADAMRFALMNSPVMRGEAVAFGDELIEESYKKNISRLESVMDFYEMYKSQNPEQSSDINSLEGDNVLDLWIKIRLQEVINTSVKGYESYELDVAVSAIPEFIDDLSTWYLRRSRDRLRSGDVGAINTLEYVLREFAKVIAPAMPFLAERVYGVMNGEKESVHLEKYPELKDLSEEDKTMLKEMKEVRNMVADLLMLRQKSNVPVRQPLSCATLNKEISDKYKDIIKEEINVKKIAIDCDLEKSMLDLNITEDLKKEGQEREWIRKINDERKSLGLIYTDNIEIALKTEEDFNFINESISIKSAVNIQKVFLEESLECVFTIIKI